MLLLLEIERCGQFIFYFQRVGNDIIQITDNYLLYSSLNFDILPCTRHFIMRFLSSTSLFSVFAASAASLQSLKSLMATDSAKGSWEVMHKIAKIMPCRNPNVSCNPRDMACGMAGRIAAIYVCNAFGQWEVEEYCDRPPVCCLFRDYSIPYCAC